MRLRCGAGEIKEQSNMGKGMVGAAVLALGIAAAGQAAAPRAVAIAPVVAGRQLDLDRGAAAVWQSLKKLDTRASLLLVVAHPDDEDGGMLTYESRGVGARVALLTLNRGEGGENLMSNDFYDALGLVRTQELLASDRYYGVEQYFTRAVDFGFSKTEKETLELWGHERVRGRAERRARQPRRGGRDCAGGVQRRLRPEDVSATTQGRAAAVVSVESVCAGAGGGVHAARHLRFGQPGVCAGQDIRLRAPDLDRGPTLDHAARARGRIRSRAGRELYPDCAPGAGQPTDAVGRHRRARPGGGKHPVPPLCQPDQ